ncbi:alpha/beta hydrolase [Parasphingorhabdus litoris]|uniref:Alpha/beta hydrolase n=1 Tax=Parasphingorhabdus litoris TaxID=394733 RepID=A0ABN1A8S7_9SPHN|nr:alpha/beta fold hydrolase [Parasphingorhabdus litoris]
MTLHYISRGNPEGLPVVFLHGGSFTGRMWLDIVDRMPEFYSIIPDLPGHGGSANRPLVSLEQAADDVADLITSLFNDRPIYLVGLSLGGYTSLQLLIRHPERIKRAVVSGVHAGGMPHARLMILATTLSSPLMRLRWFREKMVKMMGLDDYSLVSDKNGRPNANPKTMRAVGRLAAEYDVRERISAITTPTLLLAGAKEHPIILKDLALFQNDMQNCQAMQVPDMGHGWCGEDPELFANTVRAWLNEQVLPDPLESIGR